MRVDTTVEGDEGLLAAWYFPTVGKERGPAVAMAHGFSAVKEMCLQGFGEAFAAAGIAAVIFDHPGFGASQGHPRQETDPDRQVAAYRAALRWLSERPDVDPDRLGVWGTSFSGGHAITIAATEPSIRAAVAQVPYVGMGAPPVPPALAEPIEADAARRAAGGVPTLVPVVAEDPSDFAVLRSPDAYPWFTQTAAASAPAWRNEVTLASVGLLMGYDPQARAGDVSAPLLIVVADEDALAPPEPARAVARLAPRAELVEVHGGHFDPYGRLLPEASAAAADWFRANL